MEWTGTVTIAMRADGALPGNASMIKFKGSEITTYTLRGDGTASWTSSLSSSTDMGGRYAIPLTGSGGGVGTASVSYNGQAWDIGVDTDGDYPTEEDHTAEDRVMARDGVARIAVEIAKAMGEPFTLEPRVEKGRMSPLTGSAGALDPATATHLSGSRTEPHESEPIGGMSGVLATMTVTWNLTRTRVPPHVGIYGPECGCLEADETEKSLHFIAGASPTGGDFSEFIVTSDGAMPVIVNNTGGAQPSLDITGTKDTGTVTLKIRYTQNGTRVDSPPFSVAFCAIDKIELPDDEHDLAFDAFDRLQVNAKSKAWRGGKDVSAELEWDIEKMGGPTSLAAQPATKKGDTIRFTYDNLPEKNSEFGKKKLTAKLTGKCPCQRDDTIRTFFAADDKNHPGGQTPNWFYYWSQTGAAPEAARGILRYRASVEDPRMPGESAAMYDPETARLFLSAVVATDNGCQPRRNRDTHLQTGDHAKGIDCFAEDVRHEMQHRQDAIDWWGDPHGFASVNVVSWLARDWDADQVPNVIEDAHPRCDKGSLMPDLSTGVRDTWFTCSERPFSRASDAEINAYWTGWSWPLNSVNGEDWSCGPLAKQWKGKACGR
jgi:hypothetical protein